MRLIQAREMGFLERELKLWLEEGLIGTEQAEGIRGLYGVRRRPLPLILLEAGGALLALGAICFAAANWRSFSRFLKTALVTGAYLTCLLATWGTWGKSPRAARFFLLLSSLVYGAGLFLLAHLFFPEVRALSLLRCWLGGVLLFALFFREPWQALLSQAIALLYFLWSGAVSLFGEWALRPVSEFFLPVETWPILGALWAAALWTRGRGVSLYALVLLTLAVLESRVRVCLGFSAGLVVTAVLGAGLSLWPARKWSLGDAWADLFSLAFLGLVLAGVCGLALTYPKCWGDFFTKIPPFARAGVLAAGAAVALALLMLWQFHRGQAAGGAFLALLAARYFFDGVFGLLSRAWGFTVLGAVCLSLGFVLWRRKG